MHLHIGETDHPPLSLLFVQHVGPEILDAALGRHLNDSGVGSKKPDVLDLVRLLIVFQRAGVDEPQIFADRGLPLVPFPERVDVIGIVGKYRPSLLRLIRFVLFTRPAYTRRPNTASNGLPSTVALTVRVQLCEPNFASASAAAGLVNSTGMPACELAA